MRESITNIASTERCYGCGACVVACPQGAISMQIDERGFLRPTVASEDCSGCGLCARVCPALVDGELNNLLRLDPFAVWAEDGKTRWIASSGGAALLMALTFVHKGYTVLGAEFTPDFREVRHIVVHSPPEAIGLAGSKYVQSNAGAAFRRALLEGNRRHLAFGTPCQIGGLRNVLRETGVAEEWLLVDLFCHGVPSYLLWWAFVDDLSSKVGQLRHVELRNKLGGWHRYKVLAVGAEGVYTRDFDKTIFGWLYLANYCLRDNCYRCPFTDKSAADLRLGDFWGGEFASDQMGVSTAVPLTENGLRLIEETPGLAFRSVPVGWLLASQGRVSHKLVAKPQGSDALLAELGRGLSLPAVYRRRFALKHLVARLRRLPYRVANRVLPARAKRVLRVVRRALRG